MSSETKDADLWLAKFQGLGEIRGCLERAEARSLYMYQRCVFLRSGRISQRLDSRIFSDIGEAADAAAHEVFFASTWVPPTLGVFDDLGIRLAADLAEIRRGSVMGRQFASALQDRWNACDKSEYSVDSLMQDVNQVIFAAASVTVNIRALLARGKSR